VTGALYLLVKIVWGALPPSRRWERCPADM
jgi:hypothetical protein